MDGESDYIKLLAMVQTAQLLKSLTNGKDGHGECSADYLDQVLHNNPWQLHAAREYRPTPMVKFDRWHFVRRLRLLVSTYPEDSPSAANEEELDRLTRVLSMLQLGVPVNAKWHIKLMKLVYEENISHAALRRKLRCLNVSTDVDGNLILRDFHLVTRFFIYLLLVPTSLGVLAVLGLTVFSVVFLSSSVQVLLLGGTIFIWIAFPLIISWWLGPYSERSVRYLRNSLHIEYH